MGSTIEVARLFGANLRRIRKRADLSQEEVGWLASLHRTEVGLLERGERTPRIDTLVKLAGGLEVRPRRTSRRNGLASGAHCGREVLACARLGWRRELRGEAVDSGAATAASHRSPSRRIKRCGESCWSSANTRCCSRFPQLPASRARTRTIPSVALRSLVPSGLVGRLVGMQPVFDHRSVKDRLGLRPHRRGYALRRVVRRKMAREGRQGLTPAYTAYRGLGSDLDGRRTGGENLSRQGAKARYPAN